MSLKRPFTFQKLETFAILETHWRSIRTEGDEFDVPAIGEANPVLPDFRRRLSRASPYRVTSSQPASVGRASGEPRCADNSIVPRRRRSERPSGKDFQATVKFDHRYQDECLSLAPEKLRPSTCKYWCLPD